MLPQSLLHPVDGDNMDVRNVVILPHITRRHSSEDLDLKYRRCESLKTRIMKTCSFYLVLVTNYPTVIFLCFPAS